MTPQEYAKAKRALLETERRIAARTETRTTAIVNEARIRAEAEAIARKAQREELDRRMGVGNYKPATWFERGAQFFGLRKTGGRS